MPLTRGRCSTSLLAYVPRWGLANRLIELQAAMRVAQLANRTLLLPEMLPGLHWHQAFAVCGLYRSRCLLEEVPALATFPHAIGPPRRSLQRGRLPA